MDQGKYFRSRDEILSEFRFQESFVLNNMNAIVEIGPEFHKQLALNFRTLFHDTKLSISTFKQLELTERVKMVSTCSKFDPKNILSFIGLAHLRVTSEVGFYKPKEIPESFKTISFKKWWEEEIVLNDLNMEKWTRKDLVLHVANKDGGHIDPTLPFKYYSLAYKNSMGINFFNGASGKERALENPIPACLWQVGLEFNLSLDIFRKTNSI